MSWLMSLLFGGAVLKDGIKRGIDRVGMLSSPQYEMGGYEIYSDGRGHKYIKVNDIFQEVTVKDGDIVLKENGYLLWSRKEEENDKLRALADNDDLIFPKRRNNITGICAVEVRSMKTIAKIERNFNGECRKWYWFDPYEKDKRKLEDMGMIVRDDHFEPVPADTYAWNDPGIVISDEEFENIKKCKRKFGCCISVYDKGYWC